MAEIVDFGLQKHKIKMDSRYFDNVLSVVAGDTGRRIEVQLLDSNGMVQNTTGLNLRLNADVEGKVTFTDATLVDAATGKYQLDLSNGMFLAPGDWQFQWQITDPVGKKLHSFAFTGSVGINISEGGNQATNFYLNAEELRLKTIGLQSDFDDLGAQFKRLIDETTDKDVISAPEIIAARNGEASLNARLTKNEQETTTQFQQTAKSLVQIQNEKASINYVDAILMDIAKGGPKGPFMSITELENADYSKGKEGTWLVFDSSFSDGAHSFMWDSTNSVWKDLGVYQSTGIADGTVTVEKVDFLANDKSANMFDGKSWVNARLTLSTAGEMKIDNNIEGIDGRLFIVPVKPSTIYIIFREVPSLLNYGTAPEIKKYGQVLGGSIGVFDPIATGSVNPREVTITTGPNDKYLYVQLSTKAAKPFCRVVEGTSAMLPKKETYQYNVEHAEYVDVLSKSEFETTTFSPSKMSFMKNPDNLFDGNYLTGVRISGNDNDGVKIVSGGGTVAEIPIEPMTEYKIWREVPSRFNLGTATRKMYTDQSFDGEVQRNFSGTGTTTDPQVFIFKSGKNDRYLYINNGTSSTARPKLYLTTGELPTEIPSTYDTKYKFDETIDVAPKSYVDKEVNRIDRRIDNAGTGDSKVIQLNYTAVSKQLEILVPSKKTNKYVQYIFTLATNSSNNLNQWRVMTISVLNNELTPLHQLESQSEWEGAIKEIGVDFIGGTHGYEQNQAISILADGTPTKFESSNFSSSCRELRIVAHSKLFRRGTANDHLLDRVKVLEWNLDEYTVENRYTSKQDFEIEQAKLTLLGCRYTIINQGRRDDTFNIVPMSSSGVGELANPSKDAHLMEFWGTDFYLSAESQADYDKYPNRNQYVENFVDTNRAKMYFDVTGNYSIAAGEKLENKSIYRILV